MKQVYVGMAAIIEKEDKILILKRSPEKDFAPDSWEVVTGRLEKDESPVNGIIREVKEETGLHVDVVLPVDTGFFYRGSKEFPMVFISYYCKYLSGEVEIGWEHSEYKWVNLDDAIKNKDLEHFKIMLNNLKKMKKYLPNDFRLQFSNI